MPEPGPWQDAAPPPLPGPGGSGFGPEAPADPTKPKRGQKRPGLILTIIGLVLMVASPAPLVIAGLGVSATVSDVAAGSKAMPIIDNPITAKSLKTGDYFVWSTSGKWPTGCEITKGGPDGEAVKLGSPNNPIGLDAGYPVKAVKAFVSQGGDYTLSCDAPDPGADPVVLYFVPATRASMVSSLVLMAAASGALLLIGTVLVVTQTLRRAGWNNRMLREFGAI